MSGSGRAAWRRTRSRLETAVEEALGRLAGDPPAVRPAEADARVVVLGGGTGLSTVLGGNASLPAWGERPVAGLKREFRDVSVGVCTTDDGGSTGELVRRLPMIGIGDTRKVMLSLMDRGEWIRRYGPDVPAPDIIRQVFQHRFGERVPSRAELRDPVRVLPPEQRNACPAALRAELKSLANGAPDWVLEAMRAPRHCLGNLLLTLAVFRGVQTPRAPTLAEVERGLAAAARVIGAPAGRVHPATASPGMLIYEYANGVVAAGQSRAARARRGCAVRRVRISFSGTPRANPRLLAALRRADLIVYAPGSLYSSMLPVLLTPGVVEAIRANRRSVKILGANLWIQEGETDMSFREESRGFWVSELIEAYGRNVPGGIAGLFDVVLATSLDTVPGSIIRNYALEGKHPIHLDRTRVAALGVMPVEASLFANGRGQRESMIHHDPARFATAVRTIFDGWPRGSVPKRARETGGAPARRAPSTPPVKRGEPASARMRAAGAALAAAAVRPPELRPALEDFLWDYPDIRPDHLRGFDGVRVVENGRWKRSRQWDNVLGYYDPGTRHIMLHRHALRTPQALRANFAVALGESLLGRYIADKRWREVPGDDCRVYEIRLRPARERECWLSDAALRAYLRAAGMLPRAGDPLVCRRPVGRGTGFLPCGILFGLMYAWMLDGAFVPALDFEMRMLQWPASRLLPYQVRERAAHRELVRFFREEVFRNG
ncbi:MAG: 2-phospho-L-lactate transferase CofD family protein [Kiritimatiellae bacterium]|nr:2-phospho-L-lactate transferase CofD family protein [Kiritimatiellia bacterium]